MDALWAPHQFLRPGGVHGWRAPVGATLRERVEPLARGGGHFRTRDPPRSRVRKSPGGLQLVKSWSSPLRVPTKSIGAGKVVRTAGSCGSKSPCGGSPGREEAGEAAMMHLDALGVSPPIHRDGKVERTAGSSRSIPPRHGRPEREEVGEAARASPQTRGSRTKPAFPMCF